MPSFSDRPFSVTCEYVESGGRYGGQAFSPTSKVSGLRTWGCLCFGAQTSISVLDACPDAKTLCSCRV